MKMKLCPYCIEAMRSHGEKIYESDDKEEDKCDWCNEENDVTDCVIE